MATDLDPEEQAQVDVLMDHVIEALQPLLGEGRFAALRFFGVIQLGDKKVVIAPEASATPLAKQHLRERMRDIILGNEQPVQEGHEERVQVKTS